jgi:sRNA-binding protein
MTREQFLAALYADDAFREAFTRDPRATALSSGLTQDDAEELARMDMNALRLAARSFAKKRALKSS